jgi:hypothetical protein
MSDMKALLHTGYDSSLKFITKMTMCLEYKKLLDVKGNIQPEKSGVLPNDILERWKYRDILGQVTFYDELSM